MRWRRILKNFTKKNITFVSRDDETNPRRETIADLMKKVPTDRYVIVIDHDPKSLIQKAKTGADLQLSGHTHNGQLFPFNLFVRFMFENGYGYKKINKMDSIVSLGVGTWVAVLRLGTQSEIVFIDINGAD